MTICSKGEKYLIYNDALVFIKKKQNAKYKIIFSRILLTPAGPSKPEKKEKKHLYDVRWEEISTSSVQAKIYWEVAIKKIMQQKVMLRTLRDKSRRLEKQIRNLQTLVKNKAITDT